MAYQMGVSSEISGNLVVKIGTLWRFRAVFDRNAGFPTGPNLTFARSELPPDRQKLALRSKHRVLRSILRKCGVFTLDNPADRHYDSAALKSPDDPLNGASWQPTIGPDTAMKTFSKSLRIKEQLRRQINQSCDATFETELIGGTVHEGLFAINAAGRSSVDRPATCRYAATP